ncbi:hypothetical protein CC78DRAFT_565049 [Lojkania enalia]|uniref:Uncharacterized protein n=1 Tax=Lojkania enalia TaxID=147567 RepID=A0A9P4KHG4_9PLEO|nr:hypothetical protein CC78DRAFT_565049 [Didymosphaeria enalia]
MAPSRSFTLCCLLLSVVSTSAYAESLGRIGKRTAPLSPRQEVCDTPGWIPACPGLFACIPPGGICCSDGFTYVMPPRTCPEGTEPVATAIVSESASITTALPVSTPSAEYTWYTYTITYYYYYYYYTYFALSYDLTSSQSTYYTTVSLTATDDVEAGSSFSALSATLSYDIPTQTATPTYGSTLIATPTATTASATFIPYPTSNGTIPSATPPPQFTGAANSLRIGKGSSYGSILMLIAGAMMTIPGALMIWL